MSEGGSVLQTTRLALRPVGAEDLDDVVALHADPEVTRFVRPLDTGAARAWLRRAGEHWRERGHGPAAVLDRATGRFCGRSGLTYWPQFDETEVGWGSSRCGPTRSWAPG